MAWVTLSVDAVKMRLSDAESAAITNALSADGSRDPLPDIVAQVVYEVRGYISGSGRKLEVGCTLPQSLVNAAISRIRYELANAIPSGILMTDDRKRENESAIALLKSIKLEGFIPESAVNVDPQHVHYSMPDVKAKPQGFDAASQNGI